MFVKCKGKENPHGVGEELGVVVDPGYGTRMLLRFFGCSYPEEISKSNVRPCRFGKYHPDAKAIGRVSSGDS